MGVRTSEVGFKVRVDTRELHDLTKSAKQLSDLISELRELRATASSVINGVGNAVDKINRDTATSVATLKAEVQQLRREVEAANRAGGSRRGGAEERGAARGLESRAITITPSRIDLNRSWSISTDRSAVSPKSSWAWKTASG